MRHVFLVALAALAFAIPAAAALEPDALVLTRDSKLVAVDETGAVVGAVPTTGALSSSPVWSPDGSRIAYLAQLAPSVSRRALFVAAADGTGAREVLRDSDSEQWAGSLVWASPGEIVLHRRDESSYSAWLVPVDTGEPRLLARSADLNAAPLMQPNGTLLLYSVVMSSGALRRGLVDVRSGAQSLVPTTSTDVAWSPDGRWLAAPTSDGLEIMRPDGSGRRALVTGIDGRGYWPVGDPDWAPDGMRIAFTLRRPFPELANRFGTPTRFEVFTVAVEGGALVQLTGIGDESINAGGHYGGNAPTWWPNGARMFFARFGSSGPLQMMNPDGSCESAWPGPGFPIWRPGAAITTGGITCSSVVVRLRSRLGELAYRDRLPVTVVVRNEGTQTLRDLRLTVRTTTGVFGTGALACSLAQRVVCRLPDLEPGQERTLGFVGSSLRAGGATVTASVVYAGGGDIDPADDTASITAYVAPCELLGTWGDDRLIGTRAAERICARPGSDYIDGRGGNDTIGGGTGRDTVIGGAGRDSIDAGGGGDTIRARDGERDFVDCGSETDLVYADRGDTLHRCERVIRR